MNRALALSLVLVLAVPASAQRGKRGVLARRGLAARDLVVDRDPHAAAATDRHAAGGRLAQPVSLHTPRATTAA